MEDPTCPSTDQPSSGLVVGDNRRITPPSSAHSVSLSLDEDRQLANERIKVLVRVRPLSAYEIALASSDLVSTSATSLRVPSSSSQSHVECAFDHIFTAESTQADVYASVQPLVADVLEGYNATIFAYGQTGTGKTHTILGMHDNELAAPSRSSTPDLTLFAPSWGIIPRALIQLVDSTVSNRDCTISCAYLQIYNEKIFDLLTDKKRQKPLMLREALDGTTDMVVQGLSTYPITSLPDVMAFLKRGRLHRVVRETDMNTQSSRSHAILQVTLKSQSKDGCRRAKLNLVDLAGSEKWNKQAVKPGVEIEEMKNINTSLSALGNCIAALTQSGRKHIPYRDSSLTRLLQDSLGGNTRTVLIATITPRASDETLRTIQFADRTRAVMQCVVQSQNTPVSPRQLHLGLTAARAHIAKLKQKLHELAEQKEKQADAVDKVHKYETQMREKELAIERLHVQNGLYQQQLRDGERQIQMLMSQVQALSTPPKARYVEAPPTTLSANPTTSNQISHLESTTPSSYHYRPPLQPTATFDDRVKSSDLYKAKYGAMLPSQSPQTHPDKMHNTSLSGYLAPMPPAFSRPPQQSSTVILPTVNVTPSPNAICSQHQLKNCVLCALRLKMSVPVPSTLYSHPKARPSPRASMPALTNPPSYPATAAASEAGFCTTHHLNRCVLCNRIPAKQQPAVNYPPMEMSLNSTADGSNICTPHGLNNCVLCVHLQPQRSLSFLNSIPASSATIARMRPPVDVQR
ncbi:hypothetical protein H257_02604 [Aphanomyces astaci]|uniref:Kinesin-like protein n=1 Tax=Aphanomyces astaci TaxID=112090 RepID=W4H3I3_APHAT|nr:hypothetical protein H257_02604 [Aphanomyces astaci]ETV86146.1 hypothetical protein H257_02604 [Aphanomyces astaci]|eukprot:XP_009824618.1 hypothetical protein H257_02604 [Aphanomyces astaci]